MSYKLKSLVYFLSFIAATFVYNALDHNVQSQDTSSNEEIVVVNIEHIALETPIASK
jgi:hypothetical protein